eukprot:1144993-Pelagomonas_calceolata.AAC.3
MDGPRPVAHVAHAYFKVKNANKAEELAALARDPVCIGEEAGSLWSTKSCGDSEGNGGLAM